MGLQPAAVQASQQEEALSQELASLENSTAHLRDLQFQLEVQLKQVHGAASHNLSDQQPEARSAEMDEAKSAGLKGASVRIADLAEQEAVKSQERSTASIEVALDSALEAPPVTLEGMIFPSGNEDGECIGSFQKEAEAAVAAVVTVTFDRADYLKRHLDSLLAVHDKDADNKRKFPLHISQDGKSPKAAVADLAKSYGGRGVRYLHHQEDAAPQRLLNRRENLAYYRIANHYKFILRTFFDCFGYTRLIILEDDMELATDFFSYFEATSWLLASDPSLFCISSWNDHGQRQFVEDENRLLRSDFFPGLGWMLDRDFWAEIKAEWPKAYWDDWMRLNKVRKSRQCIRPEVCRTYNFGAKGSSKGVYYKRFLKPIKLSTSEIDWSSVDLSYLEQSRYNTQLDKMIAASKAVASRDEAAKVDGDVVIQYDSQEHYEAITGSFGMLREWKDGIPRGGYRGVVSIRWQSKTVFISPSTRFVQPLEASNATVKLDATGAVIRRKLLPRKVAGTAA